MKTAIVILNWNTEGFLKRFLPGLLQSVSKEEGAEVIVADNASSDGSVRMLETEFPQVRRIVFGTNLGFTGGYNKAFDAIVPKTPAGSQEEDGPEYFVLINSDIEVTDGWLAPLTEWMDTHPSCGACAPKLHGIPDRDRFEYAGAAGGYMDRFGYPFCRGRVMGRTEKDEGQYDTPQNVFWATGACLMVRSSLFRKLGGLDPRFFAHMEEIDLCWRMQLEGYEVTVVPQSLVYHVGGGTLPQSSPFKLYLNYRNNLLMLGNNLGKTFALMLYRKGAAQQEAAIKGAGMARRRMTARMILDGLSAAVYLASFRPACFKAVWRAHKDFRKTRAVPQAAEIGVYLARCGKKATVNGWYRKWIIPLSLAKGDRIYGSIREENFYKI